MKKEGNHPSRPSDVHPAAAIQSASETLDRYPVKRPGSICLPTAPCSLRPRHVLHGTRPPKSWRGTGTMRVGFGAREVPVLPLVSAVTVQKAGASASFRRSRLTDSRASGSGSGWLLQYSRSVRADRILTGGPTCHWSQTVKFAFLCPMPWAWCGLRKVPCGNDGKALWLVW
jgi:hypothetical protein